MNDSCFDNFPELHSNRLILRRHELADAPLMYKLRTDEQVMKFLDAHPPQSVTDIEKKIIEIRADFDHKKGINWIIALKTNPTIALGYMSLWRIDKHNNRGEIGYALAQRYWNQGIAKEAARLVIKYAYSHMGLHTIMANTNPQNIASQALLTSLGFQKEAHFRQDYYFDGQYLDSYIYGLIKEDWKGSRLS